MLQNMPFWGEILRDSGSGPSFQTLVITISSKVLAFHALYCHPPSHSLLSSLINIFHHHRPHSPSSHKHMLTYILATSSTHATPLIFLIDRDFLQIHLYQLLSQLSEATNKASVKPIPYLGYYLISTQEINSYKQTLNLESNIPQAKLFKCKALKRKDALKTFRTKLATVTMNDILSFIFRMSSDFR